MTLRYYRPDDEADEFGYGWFVDDYGEETYGWDPELARSLEVQPSNTQTANAVIEERSAQTRAIEQAPLETFMAPPPGATAPGAPPAAPVTETPLAPDAVSATPAPLGRAESVPAPGWTVEIGNARLAKANNNPGNLRFAGQAGAEDGEKGFARFASPAAGMEALVRQVGLDAGRGDTVATFVAGYAPGGVDGNNPEQYTRDLAGILGVSPDTPLSELDLNEVARGVARIESGTTASLGAQEPPSPEQLATGEGLAPMGPPGAPPAAMAQSLPPGAQAQQIGAPPGMSLGAVTMQGVDEDPAVTAERAGALASAYDQQQRAIAAAAAEQMAAAFDKARLQQEDAAERTRVLLERQAHQQASIQATEREVDELVHRPLQTVDPARVFREMSFGRALALALGSFIGGASGKFDAVGAIDKMVDRDIKAQLENIRLGEEQARSRLAVNTRRLGSLEQGIAMTRAEMRQAAGDYLQSLQLGRDAATLGGARDQALADNEVKKQQEIAKIYEARLTRKTSQFVPTPRPTPVIPATPVGTVESPEVKRARVGQFQQLAPPQQRALLEPIEKGKAGVDLAKRGLQTLMREYGIVERGGQLYLRDGNTPLAQASIDSDVVGPWLANWSITGDAKARKQRELSGWTDLKKGALAELPREPPNSFQEQILAATQPERDAQIPAAIQSAWDMVREKERLLESMSDPNAWAYLQWRNPPPAGVRHAAGRAQQ